MRDPFDYRWLEIAEGHVILFDREGDVTRYLGRLPLLDSHNLRSAVNLRLQTYAWPAIDPQDEPRAQEQFVREVAREIMGLEIGLIRTTQSDADKHPRPG